MDHLIHDINTQRIFQNLWLLGLKEPVSAIGGGYDHVATRNSDLFYALGATVRCCTLGTDSDNYWILEASNPRDRLFHIHGLEINPNGSLLALYGDKRVQVFHLPYSLEQVSVDDNGKQSVQIAVATYNIELNLTILKFLWHPAVEGCVFVVLTADNVISCFDIRTSSTPVISIDMSNWIVGEVVSIAFGNNIELEGLLTLYAMTRTGEIYVVYPFAPPMATISSNEYQVRKALDSSIESRQYIDHSFPENGEWDPKSALKKAITRQEAFYDLFVNQETYTVPLDLEATPVVQGPVFKVDTTNGYGLTTVFGDNGDFSFLVALSNDGGVNHAEYLVQLQPVLMDWCQGDEQEVKPTAGVEEKTTVYSRPRRGFGFVNNQAQKRDVLKEQQIFREKQFGNLSSLQKEKLDGFGKQAPMAIDYGTSLYFKNSKLVTKGDVKWLVDFTVDTAQGKAPKLTPTRYETVAKGNNFVGFVQIDEEVLNSGVVAVAVESKGTVATKSYDVGCPKRTNFAAQKANHNKPLAAEPNNTVIKETLSALLVKKQIPELPSSKEPPFSIDGLSTLESASNSVMERARDLTVAFSKLVAIMKQLVEQLQTQLKVYEALPEVNTDEIHNRVKKAAERLSGLLVRYQSLKKKLFDEVRTAHALRLLPLSDAERKWFNELNEYTRLVGGDDLELVTQVNDLRSECEQIKSESLSVQVSTILATSANSKQVKQMLGFLEEEGIMMDAVMTELKKLNAV